MSYGIFSSVYDILTDNVEYEKIANKICSLLFQNGINGGLLLDLGCGTGTLAFLLEEKGFEVIGVDPSEDMLSVANEKKYDLGSKAMFLCQSGEELDLYGTVDCAVCCLDTLNHIEGLEKIEETFKRLSLFMNLGGVLIFDINTPFKHKSILGDNTFVYDMDEVYCVWQNSFDGEANATQIDLDFFIKNEDNEDFSRFSESFKEYSYPLCDILKTVEGCGFEILSLCDDYGENPVTDTTQRITIAAKKIKTIFDGEIK